MRPEVFDCVERACCYITLFIGDKLLGEGTGFAFIETGEVLTAAHGVTGRCPIKQED
jgi:hypothetical protein